MSGVLPPAIFLQQLTQALVGQRFDSMIVAAGHDQGRVILAVNELELPRPSGSRPTQRFETEPQDVHLSVTNSGTSLLHILRRVRCELLEARIIPERIKHWIEPEQRRRERLSYLRHCTV